MMRLTIGNQRGVAVPVSADSGAWTSAWVLVGLLTLWEALAQAAIIPTLFFPAPSQSAAALLQLSAAGVLWNDLLVTLGRLAPGFAIGSALGIAAGVALGLSARLHRSVNPLIAIAHPLPKISLLPLALLIFGVGETSKIVIIAISTFFPTVINTTLGVRQVGAEYLDVARSYGASRGLLLRRIVLPGSVPAIISGGRLALNTAMVVTIAIELISAGQGLGARVWSAWQQLRADELFATLFVIAVFGLVTSVGLERLERRLTPWRQAT